MVTAKLYYYGASGRGNKLRLSLAAAGIEFEDVHPTCGFPPSQEQVLAWRKIGGNTTTNIPMLEMPDGKVYTQSTAIIRAIGRMGNLMPTSDDDLYLTDKLMADGEDIRSASYKSFLSWGASKEVLEKFVSTDLPLHLGNLQRQLVEGGKDYFVTDKLTIADIAVYDAVVNFGTNRDHTDGIEKFPQLLAWIKRVESEPKIAAYLASDQCKSIQMFGKEL